MTDKHTQFEGASDYRGKYTNLARWLTSILQSSTEDEQEAAPPAFTAAGHSPFTGEASQHDLPHKSLSHSRFYRQLPDFVMALLAHDSSASLHYAPLLYHLAGCRECHRAYLEYYDALRFAVSQPGTKSVAPQAYRTLSAAPPRMSGHLCQTLISQAEAVLWQARHDHQSADAEARSLLQLAIHVSASIGQSTIRRQCLQDLVRVATLFEGAPPAEQDHPGTYSYTPAFAGSGSIRGKKPSSSSNVLERSPEFQQAVIVIQARGLEGRIVQHGKMLELQLHGLDQSLRGHYVQIAVPLGSFLDPIRWSGGDAHRIRSTVPVDEHGTLVTLLGETDLRLSEPEEHNLLEAHFLLLEVRTAD